jgi:hypothetical protein
MRAQTKGLGSPVIGMKYLWFISLWVIYGL